jgi:hypothetical protein
MQDLDCGQSADQCVLGPIHRPHPADADRAEDAVTADDRSFHQRWIIVESAAVTQDIV